MPGEHGTLFPNVSSRGGGGGRERGGGEEGEGERGVKRGSEREKKKKIRDHQDINHVPPNTLPLAQVSTYGADTHTLLYTHVHTLLPHAMYCYIATRYTCT